MILFSTSFLVFVLIKLEIKLEIHIYYAEYKICFPMFKGRVKRTNERNHTFRIIFRWLFKMLHILFNHISVSNEHICIRFQKFLILSKDLEYSI